MIGDPPADLPQGVRLATGDERPTTALLLASEYAGQTAGLVVDL